MQEGNRPVLAVAPNFHLNEKNSFHQDCMLWRQRGMTQIKLLPLAHSCGGFCLPPVPASHDCLSGQDVHSLSCVKSCRSVYVPAGQAWIVSLGSEDPAGQQYPASHFTGGHVRPAWGQAMPEIHDRQSCRLSLRIKALKVPFGQATGSCVPLSQQCPGGQSLQSS